jgi:predicted Zn-dependent protease
MNKRLEMLEQMTQRGDADAFAWYGLAMEYRRLERPEDALVTFEKLRDNHPDYLPQYLMAGQLLIEREDFEHATQWLKAGVELAGRVGDAKALGELEEALASLS